MPLTSFVGTLQADSDNVLDLINTGYEVRLSITLSSRDIVV